MVLNCLKQFYTVLNCIELDRNVSNLSIPLYQLAEDRS